MAARRRFPNYLNQTRGWRSWWLTLDHKRIGVMYLVAVLTAFLAGGIFAMLIRIEHLTPGQTIMTAEQYNRVFTMHGVVMMFLFVIPAIPASLGNFVLPLMLGARNVAFPRLNLAAFYVYLLGALFTVTAMVTGGVDTGWTFYTPYSTTTRGSVDLMTMGIFILGISTVITSINFIVTIHQMRAPGMGWFEMPLFSWGLYATSVIQVLATPVLAITLVLLLMERVFQMGIFDSRLGGDPLLFQHFFWFFAHPVVYVMILPGMAIVSEVIPTFSRKTIFGYKAIAYSTLAIAGIGFLVWGHHMFVAGQSDLSTVIFSLLTFLVAIPSGVKMFNWLATMYRGSISFEAPMLYAIVFMLLFGIGGLTGLFLGALSVDVHLHDTYFVVAHFHFVMMGGTVMAFLAGLHYWWPKMTGRMYSEKAARVACGLIFVGFNMTFLTLYVLGSRGMPRRYYNYLAQYQGLHVFATVGSWVLGLGLFVVLAYLLASLRKPMDAAGNPWGGTTLEWTAQSPPLAENFENEPALERLPYDYRPAETSA